MPPLRIRVEPSATPMRSMLVYRCPHMVLRRSARFSRAAVASLAAFAFAAGCSGASLPPRRLPRVDARCDADHLNACERVIASALVEGAVSHDLAAAYAEGRAFRDAADEWASLFHELDRGSRPVAVVVAEGAVPAVAVKLGEGVRVVVVKA